MKKISYIRDKRSPVSSSELASKVMSSIGDKNTKPELKIRKLLWRNKLRGYRIHYKVAGKPDIVFAKQKLAIFIHGCYWHRCPKCNLPLPKSNTEFWKNKFEKNVERDKKKLDILNNLGWNVMVFWECEINSEPLNIINRIKTKLI